MLLPVKKIIRSTNDEEIDQYILKNNIVNEYRTSFGKKKSVKKIRKASFFKTEKVR